MKRTIITFTLLAAAVFGLFGLSRSQWRERAGEYQSSLPERNIRVLTGGSSLDTAGLRELHDLLADGDIRDRLEAVEDSLLALREQLSRYRGILMAAQQAVRNDYPGRGSRFRKLYFDAARELTGLEREAAGTAGALDSLETGLRGVEGIAGPAGSGGGEPVRIKWLVPERVPVREACVTCHLPVGDGSSVMLRPGAEQEQYPELMKVHPAREFGCTACHLGSARALEPSAAHGPDRLGRSFRPGKLTYRSCGKCHAESSPLRYAQASFAWPAECVSCHEADTLSVLAESASFTGQDSRVDELRLRRWLLRHWTGKQGAFPERGRLEEVAALLVSGSDPGPGGKRNPVVLQTVTGTAGKETGSILRCPECGRNFEAGGGRAGSFHCPVDGAELVAREGP